MAKLNETIAPGSNAFNTIVAGTTIKGDIDTPNDIRFDGTLVGNLKTNGKLIIGSTGQIKGEISCKNCDVEGKVQGKIAANELLSLKSTSILEGEIVVKRLAIEPGAKFTGNCNMNIAGGARPEAEKEPAEIKK